jgi:hypothetical protein
MRKASWLIIGLTVAACFALIPTSASADIITPGICDTVREIRQFNLGVRKGRNLGASAVARVGGDDACGDLAALDELRELIQAITDGIAIPAPVTDVTRCHVFGQIAGLIAAVEDLVDECGEICTEDGEFIGAVSAQLYCALSIALDGLVPVELFVRLATDTCGDLFQIACDDLFETTAVLDLACQPFTEGTFTEVFREVQNNQCADNPEDP